jgi:hypothetical protein
MATFSTGIPSGTPNQVTLSSAQTGNGASTNIVDRMGNTGPALLKIDSTVGGTPTVTVAIEGSPNGSNWVSVAYTEVATPETISVATFDIISATTTWKIIREGHPWRFLRLFYSANTNVTLTATMFVY